MKRKFYKFISSAKQGLFVLALTVLSITANSQLTYTLNYTGSVQTLTLPLGNYEIACWGANGGDITVVNSGGGIGGYSRGEFLVVTPGTLLNILVGGSGVSVNGTSSPAGAGGWNGGGGGGRTGRSGAGGGGATDVRVGGIAAANRIIVAGGGGGAAYYNQMAAGGNGGGIMGQNGNIITSGNITTVGGGGAGANGASPGLSPNAFLTTNGTATGGGGGGQSPGIGFGQPGIGGGAGGAGGGSGSGSTGSSGGGGGGYAGGAGGTQLSNVGAAGGGGSGFVGGVTNGTTVVFGQPGYATKPALTGNGIVVITRLCNFSLTAAGTNSNGAICAGQSVTITTDAISNYTWSTGSNASSITSSPSVTTTYSLTAMSPSNCMTSAAITVTVNGAIPSLTVVNTATAASGICPGNTVALTGSGATNYLWTGGVMNGVAFTPTAASAYTLTGHNACGSTIAVTSVSVHPYPNVTASITQPSVCSGNTVATLASGAVSYTWSNGVPNGSPFFPSATTIYTVTGTSALGCTNTAAVGVTVEVTPVLAPLATPTVICIGGSGTITAQGATNYTWMPGNLNTSSIIITPTVTTTWTLTKSNSNCVDVKTITVFVNQLPNVFAISSHTVVCAGSSATLSGGGASSYTWTPSSFNLTGNNVVVTPTALTIYTCTGSDGTCTSQYNVQVGTNPVPTLVAVASSPTLCAGQSVTITANGADNYTWTPGPLNGSVVVVTPAQPTAYQIVGTNSFNCASQIQLPIIVFPNPTITATPNRPLVCVNGPSTITAVGANTYIWSTGSLTNSTVVNPNVTSVYTVTGTYANSGCSTSKTVQVQAYTPVTAINGPTAVCIGSSITISSAPANSYTWTLGGIFLSNQPNLVVGPVANTTYSLATTSTSAGVSCVGGNAVMIQVNALPIVTASSTRTLICRDYESTELVAGGAVTYNWLFLGPGNSVTVSPIGQTIYTVQGTDANGCVNVATILIRVSACVGIGENANSKAGISVYPNPNNGEFSISSKTELELQVINELGQVVREVKLDANNNYKMEVKGLSQGIYILSDRSGNTLLNQKLIIQN